MTPEEEVELRKTGKYHPKMLDAPKALVRLLQAFCQTWPGTVFDFPRGSFLPCGGVAIGMLYVDGLYARFQLVDPEGEERSHPTYHLRPDGGFSERGLAPKPKKPRAVPAEPVGNPRWRRNGVNPVDPTTGKPKLGRPPSKKKKQKPKRLKRVKVEREKPPPRMRLAERIAAIAALEGDG